MPGAPTLYLAGPMTGYVDFNRPAFRLAAVQLMAAGYPVRTPLETPEHDANGVQRAYTAFLRDDLAILLKADGVALLPGWSQSKGVMLELHVAAALDMPCRTIEEWVALAAVRDDRV